MNYKEQRPWGEFENLLDTEYCKVKQIIIKPGQAPSYQYHYKRSEVYVIVQGKAKVCLDDIETEYNVGDTVIVPILAPPNVTTLSGLVANPFPLLPFIIFP